MQEKVVRLTSKPAFNDFFRENLKPDISISSFSAHVHMPSLCPFEYKPLLQQELKVIFPETLIFCSIQTAEKPFPKFPWVFLLDNA